jgi:hypothetical protein
VLLRPGSNQIALPKGEAQIMLLFGVLVPINDNFSIIVDKVRHDLFQYFEVRSTDILAFTK